jgi:hypothetical protein
MKEILLSIFVVIAGLYAIYVSYQAIILWGKL